MLAVRWYLRYALSYRDVEEILAERGLVVDHVTVYRWVQRFTPLLIDARSCRHIPGTGRVRPGERRPLKPRWKTLIVHVTRVLPSRLPSTRPWGVGHHSGRRNR